MSKAGKYDYPSRDLDLCISALAKANEFAKETSFRRDAFAEAIGQKPKGGGFNVLVGSLAQYKLVDTGEGMIRFTQLGKTLIHGEESEKLRAKSEAVRNIVLFSDIYDKFGAHPKDEQLRLFLREKAGVDISEVNSLSLEVGKSFIRVAQYLQGIDEKQHTETGGDSMNTVTETQTTDTWKLVSPYGSTLIKDTASLIAVKALLSVAEKTFSENSSNHIKGKKDSIELT